MNIIDVDSTFVLDTDHVGINQSEILIQETPITNDNWKFFVFLIVLSTFFLFLSVIIYILLREKQNIHGWTQFSYLLSFLLFNIVFIPALCPGLVQGSEVTWGCFILAAANQYFFICSKTWLLIISLDILWNLWKFELPMDGNSRYAKRLSLYSTIGWGFPSILVASGISMNLTHTQILQSMPYDSSLWVPIPDYGHLHCRIPNWTVWEIFVFSNCLSHIVMFSLIIFFIVRHRYHARDAIRSSSRQNNNKSIVMFIKLFFVVGLSWSYIALQDLLKAGNINTRQGWCWHIFRIVFFLQGVFISLIYVCNEKTLRSLEEKYPAVEKMSKSLVNSCQLCSWAEKLRRESMSTLSTLSSLHLPKSKVWTVSNAKMSRPKESSVINV